MKTVLVFVLSVIAVLLLVPLFAAMYVRYFEWVAHVMGFAS